MLNSLCHLCFIFCWLSLISVENSYRPLCILAFLCHDYYYALCFPGMNFTWDWWINVFCQISWVFGNVTVLIEKTCWQFMHVNVNRGTFCFPAVYSSHLVVELQFVVVRKLSCWMAGKSSCRKNLIPIPDESRLCQMKLPPFMRRLVFISLFRKGLREKE